MSPQDFCYWLQGFAELTDKPPTPAQWKMIQEHLALAFQKVTPPLMPSNPFPPNWPNGVTVTC